MMSSQKMVSPLNHCSFEMSESDLVALNELPQSDQHLLFVRSTKSIIAELATCICSMF